MAAIKRNKLIEVLWALHRKAYHLSGGRIGTRAGRQAFLLLTTTGRKSGEARTVALTYLAKDGDYVVVGSHLGEDRHPAWVLNLRAQPQATVRVGRLIRPVIAREAEGDERQHLFQRFVHEIDAAYAEYEARTSRVFPVIVLEAAAP